MSCQNHTHHEHHGHHHGHETDTQMTFEEKMVKLIEHWIKHNEEHAVQFRNWAQKAKENQLDELGNVLEEAAQKTLLLNAVFQKGNDLIK